MTIKQINVDMELEMKNKIYLYGNGLCFGVLRGCEIRASTARASHSMRICRNMTHTEFDGQPRQQSILRSFARLWYGT